MAWDVSRHYHLWCIPLDVAFAERLPYFSLSWAFLQAEKSSRLNRRRSSSARRSYMWCSLPRGYFYLRVGPLIPACSALIWLSCRLPQAICLNCRSLLLLMEALILNCSVRSRASLFVMYFVCDMSKRLIVENIQFLLNQVTYRPHLRVVQENR